MYDKNVRIERTSRNLEFVEGDLILENGTVQVTNDELKVIGNTKCYGDCTINGSISTENFESISGKIRINGGLTVLKNIKIKDDLFLTGDLKSDYVEIEKRAEIGGNVDVYEMSVGGKLDVKGKINARSEERL